MGRTRRLIGGAGVVAMVLSAAACASSSGSGSSAGAPAFDSQGSALPRSASGAGWTDCPTGTCSWGDGTKTARSRGGRSSAGVVTGAANEAPAGAASKQSTTTVARPPSQPSQSRGPVYASSVDDNAGWDTYLQYRLQFAADHPGASVEDIPVDNRKVITVVDDHHQPVLGADVVVTDSSGAKVATARTHADGRAVFFPASRQDLAATAAKGPTSAKIAIPADRSDAEATLPGTARVAPKLDVVFLLDATGSMGDEIEQLKANITAIAATVDGKTSRPRFGLTLYRDHGDLFGTRTFDLTGDPSAFAAALREVQADGGGDAPEDLTAGLHDALTKPSWGETDTIKLVILVGDAPPHIDYGPRYSDEVRRAQATGIKVLSIGAQGLDAPGEYVFRQLSEQTLGRYVYLVNGPSGATGGARSTGSVPASDLGVLPLDQLVVRLVEDELRLAG